MFLTFRVSKSTLAKVLGVPAIGLAVLAGCAVGSSDDSNEARPSSSTSANTQPSPSVTGASSTTTTEPSASPSTSQPEASASESTGKLTSGRVAAAFEDGPHGPFLVLVPFDASQSDLEYAASFQDALRNLDKTMLPVSEIGKVDVSADVFRSCAPDKARKVFQDYPSCAGSADTADTAPTSTDR